MLNRTKSILLTLIVLLMLAAAPSKTQAQQARNVFDTGVITLGPNQVLRVHVAAGDVNGDGVVAVHFRRMGYQLTKVGQGGVSIYKVAAQNTAPAIMLSAGETASIDISQMFLGGVFQDVRGMVITNSKAVKVTAELINPDGSVAAFFDVFTEIS